jgi:putative membrane protein
MPFFFSSSPAPGSGWGAFLKRWAVVALAVLVASQVVSGIRYDSPGALLAASLILGILNSFLRPVLMLLSLPFLILTLGLFTLFINAFLLYLVAAVVPSFHVDSFGSAFWGGLVISMVSIFVNTLTRRPPGPPATPGSPQSQPRVSSDDRGPIIDV